MTPVPLRKRSMHLYIYVTAIYGWPKIKSASSILRLGGGKGYELNQAVEKTPEESGVGQRAQRPVASHSVIIGVV